MSGGTPKTQTVTQKNDPPEWAIGSFKDMLARGNTLADTPYVPYTGQLVAGQNGDQLASQGMIRAMAGGPSIVSNGTNYAAGLLGGAGQYQGGSNPYMGATNAMIGAGNPLIGSISGGGRINAGTNKFAGENPYLDEMIAASSRDVTDAFTKTEIPGLLSQFQTGGAFGGTAMQNAISSSQDTLAQNLGELSNQYRFQDYQTQQGMDESRLARQAQLSDAAAAREMQASIAAAQLYDVGLGRDASLYGADLDRNAGLGENRLNRGLAAWGQYQGNQLSALGMLPGLNQAQYLGASMLGTQGQQQQALEQAWLDANYGQYMDARGWDMQRFQPLLQSLAAVQGGSVTNTSPYQGPSAMGGALGGALAGAGAGAAMGGAAKGAVFGPWGAAIGGLMGYFGSR